jgi:hypothetical protein
MINENGIYTELTLNDALTITTNAAIAAGIDIQAGSVEEQLNNWLAQIFVESDSAIYALYVKQFNPTGSDIDLQNPGTPRLQATVTSGYLKIDNTLNPDEEVIAADTIFSAPNGNTYTNGVTLLTVDAGEIGFLAVTSVNTGADQNIPSGLTFEWSGTAIVTNPQPFVTGINTETDSQYTSRIIFLKTNNSSEQATPAATKELLEFYSAARFYVNNTSNNYVTPVPVPSGGYVCVVLFPSSTLAGPEEIQNAIQVLVNRFEFGNILVAATVNHPLLLGVIYTGTFPQTFSVAPAQAVEVTLTANVNVSFSAGTADAEKEILAESFATAFVQNLINFYGGSQGEYNLEFQGAGSPLPSPILSTPTVSASTGRIKIAPVVAIEQVRSFISDNISSVPNLNYLQCAELQMIIDPQVAGEPSVTLDIEAPSGGTVAVVDFVEDSLFLDDTSWYDRYIFIDPSLITITVTEV